MENISSDDIFASESAVKFLQNIDNETLDLCIFKDDLVTVSEDGKTIGEFSTNIEKISKSGDIILMIHASSHGKVDDILMGTTITTYADVESLKLISQEHHEYVKVPGNELEKKTEMRVDSETGELTVKRQVTQGDEIRKSTFKVPKEKMDGFVTEGLNILVQRILIRSNFHEEITFVAVDSDSSHLVQSVYKPLPERKQQVGSKELTVVGIERSVMSFGDLPHSWQSYFMEDGHLTMRIQVGSPAVATLVKVPRLIEREELELKPVFGKKVLEWEEDMELHSRYLQRKEELRAGHDTYLREHPDAATLLADFFQFLLLRKPDDVVDFAADFFSAFSSQVPEQSSYKHSATGN